MKLGLFIIILSCWFEQLAQPVPAKEENIPYLVTFSKDAAASYGDDDHSQVFFFSLPMDYNKPFYIRIFDPDVGGMHDEVNGSNKKFNSTTEFSLYGGNGCISEKDAVGIDPKGNYKSGNLISSNTFGVDNSLDNNWFTIGPINPAEGEKSPQYYGYIFKLIADGLTGDDGNLYRYFLSSSSNQNIPIEGGNAFTFEYTFRLPDKVNNISHIYPFVNDDVVSIKQTNFDWDYGGAIKLYSVSTLAKSMDVSGDDKHAESVYFVKKSEKGTSLDIQFQISKSRQLSNNNVVFYITNQYGETLPFFTVPSGGIPKSKGDIKFTPNPK